MKLTSEELKSLYQEGTARSAAGRAECLTAEVMMQAAKGEMSQVEREQAADHLASCSNCASEFRLVRTLRPWAEEVGQALGASAVKADETDLISDPNAVRSLLRGLEGPVAQRSTLWQRFAALLSPARAAFALAASLLILLALGGWLVLSRKESNDQIARLKEQVAEREREMDSTKKSLDQAQRRIEEERSETTVKQYEEESARLRRTIADLSSPQLDIPIVDLDPGGAIRGGPKEAATLIEAPGTANLITMILNFPGQQQYSSYEVEIIDQRGKQVWRGRSTRQSQANSLNVTIARGLVPDGRYLIKLFGLRNGKKEPVADYPVTIRYI